MKEYLASTLKILEQSIKSIDETVFEKLLNDCIDTLKKHRKIIASGLGKNVPICEKFVGTMTSLGLNAAFMNTNSATHGDLGLVHEGDLVILLTKSGETAESVYLSHFLRDRDCTVWLLTFERESTLAREIPKSLTINLRHEGDRWNLVPNNSSTMNLIVLQMLAMRLADELDITLEQFKRNHPGGHIGEVIRNG